MQARMLPEGVSGAQLWGATAASPSPSSPHLPALACSEAAACMVHHRPSVVSRRHQGHRLSKRLTGANIDGRCSMPVVRHQSRAMQGEQGVWHVWGARTAPQAPQTPQEPT